MRAISSAVQPSASAQRSGSRRRVTPANALGRSPLGTIPMRAEHQCPPPPGGAKTPVPRRQQNTPRSNALQRPRVAQSTEPLISTRIETRRGRIRWQAGGNSSASDGSAGPDCGGGGAARSGRGRGVVSEMGNGRKAGLDFFSILTFLFFKSVTFEFYHLKELGYIHCVTQVLN
jgi:hypothetical protein